MLYQNTELCFYGVFLVLLLAFRNARCTWCWDDETCWGSTFHQHGWGRYTVNVKNIY